MTFDDTRQLLATLQQSSDSLVYTQVVDWLECSYEYAKESMLRCSPEDRDMFLGKALACRDLVNDLSSPVK